MTLLPRLRHVLSEWQRVEPFTLALSENEPLQWRPLMFQSHSSCRDDYEISCPEPDLMVEISARAGAAGARLTGAGFGGCMIALVKMTGVNKVLTALAGKYYREYLHLEGDNFPHDLFLCRPAAGAGVFSL